MGVPQGGALFLGMGGAGLAACLIPGSFSYDRPWLLAADVFVLFVGLFARSRWASWLTGYRALLLPTTGLVVLAACNGKGLISPVALGVDFIAVFLWIGQWQPPGTGLRFAPVAALAYLAPYLFGATNQNGNVSSFILVVGGAVVVAEVLSRQASAARAAQARQAEAIATLSTANCTDDLTGLGNRRHGDQLLDALTPGDAVIVLDLDGFKRVNDTFGHARGDQLLREVGALLRCHTPDADGLARMGGDEFVVVCSDSSPSAALNVACHLLDQWRQTASLTTISAGVAMHSAGKSSLATYAQADAALYEAKNAGRDQAVMAEETPADRPRKRVAQQDALTTKAEDVPPPRSTSTLPSLIR